MKKISRYLFALFLSNGLTMNTVGIIYMINFFLLKELTYSFEIYNYFIIETASYILCAYLFSKENKVCKKLESYISKILLGVSIFCWAIYGILKLYIEEIYSIDNGTDEYYHIYFPVFFFYFAVVFITISKHISKKLWHKNKTGESALR